MRPLSYLILSLAVFGLMQAPALGQAKKEWIPDSLRLPPPPIPCGPSFRHLDGQMLVFVANGAGGSTNLSDNLSDLNGDKQLGLRIQTVSWARHNAAYEDLVDNEAQINAAARIACSVNAIRRDAPHAHIFFVGHSAGARVVLAAAEMLSPRSIDRIIVIAPAVSSTYDLTTALKTARYGIDHFWSPEDATLETAAERSVLADGVKGPAAGRLGFRPASCERRDIEAYRNVRQYRWTEDLCGNGGHCAWLIRHNMKKVIVPLFFQAPVCDPCPPPPVIEKKLPKVK